MRYHIIGLGLIGGSLGLALRTAGEEVLGYARRRETAEQALAMGAIDAIAPALTSDADVFVLATPLLAMRYLMGQMAPGLRDGAIVTDVGSTKAQVLAWAQELLPSGVTFVGGHPMAGKEQSGIEVAEATLFQGKTYCICPSSQAQPEAIAAIKGLAEKVGAKPLLLNAAEHDALVAAISHLPLVASAALAGAVMGDAAWPKMAELAASGFRDTTRLAAGDPTMGADILATNAANVANWLDALIGELQRWRDMITAGDDPAVRAELARMQQAVRAWRKQAGYG